MMTNKYKTALSKFSLILNSALESDKSFSKIFDFIKDIVEFDYAAMYYINADIINLKVEKNYTENKVYPYDASYFEISEDTKKLIFSKEALNLDNTSSFAKDIDLNDKKAQFIVAKLIIRETVFGFILLANFSDKRFKQEDLDILDALCAVASYSIKDNELSNVFKIQLKALQDNILEKSQAIKTIKEQNKKILEADKAKNEFIANISHELRTPLNAIIGFSDVLKSELFGKLNPKQLEYISDINSSGIHLLGMINEILDLAKIESKVMRINKKDFDLSPAVIEVINIVSPLANKKNITISKNLDESISINADHQKIQQILFNLLSNAIKFTQNNGQIVISTEKTPKKIIIKVKDTGVGIDKKFHGKIFAKFVQLNSTYTKTESSTGLGLTITKELVELHGGKIMLESKINEGSTFIVELPLEKK